MKKQIALLSFGVAIVVVFSVLVLQTNFEETNLDFEIESNTQDSDIIITNFQDNSAIVKLTGDGVPVFDKESFVVGDQSLKITTSGNGNPEIVRLTNLSPSLDFTGKFLKAWVKISDRNAVNQLRITVSSDNFESSKIYWIHQRPSSPTAKSFQNDKWSPITISLTQTTDFNKSDISKVNAIEIFLQDTGERPVTVWLDDLSLVKQNSKAIVSFTFDDALVEQYTNALPILSKYNFSGTTYVPTKWLDQPGRLSINQLREMQDVYGWDISSHTLNHIDVASSNNEYKFEDELVNSKQFLIDNGFEKGAEHFAYPFGTFDNNLSMDLIKKHYKTARIVRGDIETLPPADPYRLRVIYVLSYTPPDLVLNRIDKAIENGDWAILVFHGVVDFEPTSVQAHYPKANFKTIVDDVYKKGVEVMTVSEVYNKFLEGKK